MPSFELGRCCSTQCAADKIGRGPDSCHFARFSWLLLKKSSNDSQECPNVNKTLFTFCQKCQGFSVKKWVNFQKESGKISLATTFVYKGPNCLFLFTFSSAKVKDLVALWNVKTSACALVNRELKLKRARLNSVIRSFGFFRAETSTPCTPSHGRRPLEQPPPSSTCSKSW